MLILAIESSALVAGAAVIEDGKVLAEINISRKLNHSVTLMPCVDTVLSMIGIQIADVDCIACCSGPGSFTGLRIGAATAKGLAMSSDKPIIAVNTLDALAYNVANTENIIFPLMDAKRGQVYFAAYHNTSQMVDYGLDSIGSVLLIAEKYGKILFLGDGAIAYHDEIARIRPDAIFANANNMVQRASSVGLAAFETAKRGEILNHMDFSPFYLRQAQPDEIKAKA